MRMPVNSGSTPPASISSLERPPTCIKVRYSVHAPCTYASDPAARPVVSSACSTGAVRSKTRMWGRNPASSATAPRLRTPAMNPVETAIPALRASRVVARAIGR